MSSLLLPRSLCCRTLQRLPSLASRGTSLSTRYLSDVAPPLVTGSPPTSRAAFRVPQTQATSKILHMFSARSHPAKPKPRFFATSFPLSVRPLETTFFTHRSLSTASVASTADFASVAASEGPIPTASATEPLPPLSPPSVGFWLLALAGLSFAIVSVGGVTRLTESGLSITEWRPVTGTLPPLSDAEWEVEFAKYRETPEFKMLNANITLDAFKRIYYMEYSHRLLGRIIGLALILPFGYFYLRRRLTPGLPAKLTGLTVLLGAQGALGWYMVASGLEDEILTTPGAVPRVSQYRLAAHLGAALVFYSGLVLTGLAVLRDAAYVRGRGWRADGGWERAWAAGPRQMRAFRLATYAVGALVFVTALSGAFVAGLDAGLIYNEFPLMGGRLIPPGEELVRPEFSHVRIKHTRSLPSPTGATGEKEQVVEVEEKNQPWRNIFENPTTVQFDHRALAMTTYAAVGALWLLSRRVRPALPRPARSLAGWAFAFANVQVALGISTLLYLVPVPLAAAHQAGSVCLLTCMLALAAVMRRPGKWARVWREAVKKGQAKVQ